MKLPPQASRPAMDGAAEAAIEAPSDDDR